MHTDLIHLAKQVLLSLPFIALGIAGAWTVWANTRPVVRGLWGDHE